MTPDPGSEWDEAAAGWDTDPIVGAYAEAAYTSLVALVDDIGLSLAGSAVCDFGCGTGLLTERLADRCGRIDAIDTSPAMLDVVRSKIAHHGWGHVRPLTGLPAAPQRYDAVVCSSVLAFVDDYSATVARLVEHLADGGVFVQWDWELDPSEEEPFGLGREQIRCTLEGAGLRAVEVGVGFEVAIDGAVMRPLMGCGRR